MNSEFWTWLAVGLLIGAGVGYFRCTGMKAAVQ